MQKETNMASILPKTVQDLMDEIYVAVDNDPTNSTNVDDEWTARLRLINMAISNWESQDCYWNELWDTYTHASTVSSATSYPIAAADYRLPGSYMKFTLNGSDTYLEIVHPEEAFKYAKNGAAAVYITGNQRDGFTINLTFTPADGDQYYGSTMSHNYYKSATRMTTTTSDIPEMSDPEYIVNFVAYRKNLYNGRSNVASDYQAAAQRCMDDMISRNDERVNYGSSAIEDIDSIRYNSVMGL